MEWLWKTCEQCWAEACRIVGVRKTGVICLSDHMMHAGVAVESSEA